MNERLVVIGLEAGEVGVTLGNLFQYMTVPVNLTIVAVYAAPSVDDADTTIDINDDGSEAIAGVACATKATPGSWISTHFGGANAPVKVAADSVLSFDANNAAADTRVNVWVWALVGEAS